MWVLAGDLQVLPSKRFHFQKVGLIGMRIMDAEGILSLITLLIILVPSFGVYQASDVKKLNISNYIIPNHNNLQSKSYRLQK